VPSLRPSLDRDPSIVGLMLSRRSRDRDWRHWVPATRTSQIEAMLETISTDRNEFLAGLVDLVDGAAVKWDALPLHFWRRTCPDVPRQKNHPQKKKKMLSPR